MTKARDLANAGTALTSVSATELGYLDGVTSAVQTQMDAKLATSTASTTYQSLANNNAAGKNAVINGGFDIWQRGTSFTSNGYIADHWYGLTPTNITISRQLTGDTTNLPNIQYCVRLARSAGSTAAVYPQVTNSFETINSIPFAGKTVTLSFYARRGANFSASGNQISAYVPTGTGTDENVSNGYTGETNPVGGVATLTTTWQRFTFTGTIPTTATEMGVKIFALTSGTAGAADYFEVAGVQVELGSTATSFSRNASTYQNELVVAGSPTNGQVLTSDSTISTGIKWATPVAGAFTLISSTTLSGTSVTLSAIPQTYKQLYLSIVNPVSSSGHTLNLVTQRTDGYGTTNTYYVGQYSNNGGAQVGFAARADIPLTPTGSMSSGAEVSTFEVTFYNYANYRSTYFATSGYSNTSSQRIIAMQSGMIDNNNVYNIVISGGTFTGGSVNLYGVN